MFFQMILDSECLDLLITQGHCYAILCLFQDFANFLKHSGSLRFTGLRFSALTRDIKPNSQKLCNFPNQHGNIEFMQC